MAPRQRFQAARLRIQTTPTRSRPMAPSGSTTTISPPSCSAIMTSSHSHSTGDCPIMAEAKRLAEAIATALDARKTSAAAGADHRPFDGRAALRVPCRLVDPATWDRMMQSDGARILMLGTPNGGSWTPMQVLSGDDSFGNLLINVGAPFASNEIAPADRRLPGIRSAPGGPVERTRYGERPGEISQRPISMPSARAARGTVWHFSSLNSNGVFRRKPCSTMRCRAPSRARQSNATGTSSPGPTGCCWWSARRQPRLAGYEGARDGDRGLVYLEVGDGDGRVYAGKRGASGSSDLARAIPITVRCRGSRAAFEAYRELLNTGTTKRLARVSAIRHRPAEGRRHRRAGGASAVRPTAGAAIAASEPELDVLSSAAARVRKPRRCRRPCTSRSSTAISPLSPNHC